MSKLKHMYDSFLGKHALCFEEYQNYNEITLPNFLSNNENYLLYDDMSNKVLLLSEHEMREHYKNGNYRDKDDLVETFEDFCLNSCIEVLKTFSNYSFEEIREIFKKHYLLKLYTF